MSGIRRKSERNNMILLIIIISFLRCMGIKFIKEKHSSSFYTTFDFILTKMIEKRNRKVVIHIIRFE